MRKFLIPLALVALALVACGPVKQTSQSRDAQRTEAQQQTYEVNQPIPQFQFSQERDTLIQLYRLQNEARATYTVVTGINGGKPIWACASRGYALPADTQLTNPQQLAGAWVVSGSSGNDTRTDSSGNYWRWVDGVIELPEPNGIYSSKNTDGTWVMCVRPDGSVNPVYTELKANVFPFEVKWDPEQQVLVDVGQRSSSTVEIRTSAPVVAPSPVPTRP